jgi:hypothetical protein
MTPNLQAALRLQSEAKAATAKASKAYHEADSLAGRLYYSPRTRFTLACGRAEAKRLVAFSHLEAAIRDESEAAVRVFEALNPEDA